jgi:cytochrome c
MPRNLANFKLTAGAMVLGATLFSLPSAAAPELQLCDSHGLVRGAEIAMEKGCFGCHTLSTKRVGPPYRQISAKYGQHPTAVATLAAKIKNGGTGVWGTAVMPPNPITQEEAEVLARWIQAL